MEKPKPEDYTFNGVLVQPDYDRSVEAWEKLVKLNNTDQSIMDEIEEDLLDGCMPVGEVESCLIHWRNKYLIIRKIPA